MISKQTTNGTAKDCLMIEGNRPSTPLEIKKFRHYVDPGKKFIHHGLADDYPNMGLDNKKFGQTSEKDKTRASDLIQHKTPTQFEQIEQLKAERIYKSTKREMLGQAIDRNMTLPSKFTEEKQPFGSSTRLAKDALKDVLFPEDRPIDEDSEQMYIRTHHSYRPAEQTNRHYNWPIDPHETRFGTPGVSVPKNGASQNVHDVLHAKTNYTDDELLQNGDLKSKIKPSIHSTVNLPPDHAYGKPYVKSRRNVGEAIRGKYNDNAQQPDIDLGKSITPGFRNHTSDDTIYGAPSSKLTNTIMLKSIIDPTSTAGMLISPQISTSKSPHNIFDQKMTRNEILTIFNKSGNTLTRDIIDTVFDRARAGNVMVLADFQFELNEYLDSIENH